MRIPVENSLDKSVRYLKGIGPRRAESLERLGIKTVRDLCFFFPRRYEDRSHFQKISELQPGTFATLSGKISKVTLKPLKRIQLLEVWLRDETSFLPAIWFNQPYLKNYFQEGNSLILNGKVELYRNQLQMVSPDYEIADLADDDPVHVGRITPIYPLTEGLFQRSLRVVMSRLMNSGIDRELKEHLPTDLVTKFNFLPLAQAVKQIHFPETYEQLEEARRRLVFDEFYLLELRLLHKLNETKNRFRSIPLKLSADSLDQFKSNLPFALTRDQERAIQELIHDVQLDVPMHRLLQGEVGSGKTVVAAHLLQTAAENGVQAAFLVPTEILAEQHEATLKRILSKSPTRIKLLTASVLGDERQRILDDTQSGKIDVLVGTHAVLQDAVNFKNLGVVIIDEQHKFGVRQRAKLLARNPRPHLLIMSATPIPRTLGLTLYGDLDISEIRELPKGRKPIATRHFSTKERPKVLRMVKERIQDGEQAYILFPIIEETEKADLQSAKQEYERLRKNEFKPAEIGLIHGKLSKEERDDVMGNFQAGKLKVLVATSVIEVGVDNPHATTMVIEHADRFGLSQLHQIRGRIGRGAKESVCFLIADPKTDQASRRIEILTKTLDGFLIAEEDLKLRGPGEFFGLRQSGAPPFRLADFAKDLDVLLRARDEAKRILERDPLLTSTENAVLKNRMEMT